MLTISFSFSSCYPPFTSTHKLLLLFPFLSDLTYFTNFLCPLLFQSFFPPFCKSLSAFMSLLCFQTHSSFYLVWTKRKNKIFSLLVLVSFMLQMNQRWKLSCMSQGLTGPALTAVWRSGTDYEHYWLRLQLHPLCHK